METREILFVLAAFGAVMFIAGCDFEAPECTGQYKCSANGTQIESCSGHTWTVVEQCPEGTLCNKSLGWRPTEKPNCAGTCVDPYSGDEHPFGAKGCYNFSTFAECGNKDDGSIGWLVTDCTQNEGEVCYGNKCQAGCVFQETAYKSGMVRCQELDSKGEYRHFNCSSEGDWVDVDGCPEGTKCIGMLCS
ncbi:MAG: hypothetical protein R6U32_07605 [Candidatus Woesearchaeota archaeon]